MSPYPTPAKRSSHHQPEEKKSKYGRITADWLPAGISLRSLSFLQISGLLDFEQLKIIFKMCRAVSIGTD